MQYHVVCTLNESLHSSKVTCQMDLAENWNTDQNQVQSAYFDPSLRRLYPGPGIRGIVCLHCGRQKPKCQHSLCRGEGSDQVKQPGQWRVLFITDSRTSQYRNKTLVCLMATTKKLLGVEVSWTYLKAGHSKGRCDGVGGSVKRVTDQEVNKGSLIQNTWDLYKVMCQLPSKVT